MIYGLLLLGGILSITGIIIGFCSIWYEPSKKAYETLISFAFTLCLIGTICMFTAGVN